MPRIFYGNNLVSDCESWFNTLRYIEKTWNNSSKWTDENTDKVCNLLLKGVQRHVACSIVLDVLKMKLNSTNIVEKEDV